MGSGIGRWTQVVVSVSGTSFLVAFILLSKVGSKVINLKRMEEEVLEGPEEGI